MAHHDVAAYTQEHRRLFELIAARAAPVFYNSLVFEETQRASLTDPLTGLLNRRGMQDHVEAALARALEQGRSAALLLMDLDGFKTLNDTYGHQTGDLALRHVAAALRSGLRSYDMCARFAGDEFVVVFWDCSGVGSGIATHRDRRRGQQHAIRGAARRVHRPARQRRCVLGTARRRDARSPRRRR